jgi:hypothetical protein
MVRFLSLQICPGQYVLSSDPTGAHLQQSHLTFDLITPDGALHFDADTEATEDVVAEERESAASGDDGGRYLEDSDEEDGAARAVERNGTRPSKPLETTRTYRVKSSAGRMDPLPIAMGRAVG